MEYYMVIDLYLWAVSTEVLVIGYAVVWDIIDPYILLSQYHSLVKLPWACGIDLWKWCKYFIKQWSSSTLYLLTYMKIV